MINLDKYAEFVDGVTSAESKNWDDFIISLSEIDYDVNIPRMLTASLGLSSESGEFNEIIKKCIFQGKPLTDDVKEHLRKELGDVIWYWVQACIALGVSPNDIIHKNVNKLMSRYPGGEFSVERSENRKAGDI